MRKQPVKDRYLSTDEILDLLIAGQHESRRIACTTRLRDENIVIPQKAFMPKNPFLARMEEKYYAKIRIRKQAD